MNYRPGSSDPFKTLLFALMGVWLISGCKEETLTRDASVPIEARRMEAEAAQPADGEDNPCLTSEARTIRPGNTPARIQGALDRGRADPKERMDRLILLLRMSPEKKERLGRLTKVQNDPKSPHYHQWLSPGEFGKRFGPSERDVNRLLRWVEGQGLEADELAPGRLWLTVSGSVEQVERAFDTEIHRFERDGQTFMANTRDPSVPKRLDSVLEGVVSLHSVPPEPTRSGEAAEASRESADESTPRPVEPMVPADITALYAIDPLFDEGLLGAGQTIAVPSQTDIDPDDLQNFRSWAGLPPAALDYYNVGVKPGILGGDDELHTLLMLQWTGAVAPEAELVLVVSATASGTDGIDLAAQDIVSYRRGSILPLPGQFACEANLTTTRQEFYSTLWAQAATEGIAVFVPAGDSGAAGCNTEVEMESYVRGVNGFCSTPDNVCVGGTQPWIEEGTPEPDTTPVDLSGDAEPLALNADAEPLALNADAEPLDLNADAEPLDLNADAEPLDLRVDAASFGSSADDTPVPETEMVWNESGTRAGGSGCLAAGGGHSIVFDRPSWQYQADDEEDSNRSVPDVSLMASSRRPYTVMRGGTSSSPNLEFVHGTRAPTAVMAGVMALVNQSQGYDQGNPAAVLYSLYAEYGEEIFRDIKSGDNNVPKVGGYVASEGFDRASGLGSFSADALVEHWYRECDYAFRGLGDPISFVKAMESKPALSVTFSNRERLRALSDALELSDGEAATLSDIVRKERDEIASLRKQIGLGSQTDSGEPPTSVREEEARSVVENHGHSGGALQPEGAASEFNASLRKIVRSSRDRLGSLLTPARMDRFLHHAERVWNSDAAKAVPSSCDSTISQYRVYMIQSDGGVELSGVPDQYAVDAAEGEYRSEENYSPGLDYSISVYRNGLEVWAPLYATGPANSDDNYWNAADDPLRPRRMFQDLPQGMPETLAAFYYGYNYGRDQYNRTVTTPAGIGLTSAAASALGLSEGEAAWVQASFMWEQGATSQTSKLTGKVLDQQGNSLAGAVVTLNYERETITSNDGSFAFGGLLPATYALTATATYYGTQTVEVEVQPHSDVYKEIILVYDGSDKLGELSGYIYAPGGYGIALSQVQVMGVQKACTNFYGFFVFEDPDLPVGPYTLQASANCYYLKCKDITIEEGPDNFVEMTLSNHGCEGYYDNCPPSGGCSVVGSPEDCPSGASPLRWAGIALLTLAIAGLRLRKGGARDGQASLEFMLMIPILFALLFLIIQIGLYFSAVHYASYVAFVCARGQEVGFSEEYPSANAVADLLLTGSLWEDAEVSSLTGPDALEPSGVAIALRDFDRKVPFPFINALEPSFSLRVRVDLGPDERAYEGVEGRSLDLYDNNL